MSSNQGWKRWVVWGAAAASLILFSGCRKETPEGVRRVALLPFEYQGSEIGNRWLADALESAASDEMRGIAGVIPIRATDAGNAAIQGATEVLRGIVSGSPESLRIQLYRESLAPGEVRPLGDNRAVSLAEALPELRRLLQAAGAAGTPFSTRNPKAFEAFGRALAAGAAAQAIPLLREAVAADPQFTSASLRLAALYQREGQIEQAEAETERLLAALPAGRALDRAYAKLQLASFRKNDAEIESALAGVVKAAPYDLEAASRLAAIYQQRRHYLGAVAVLREMVKTDGRNAALWNQIAYAEAFGGNRPGAIEALGEYRKLNPADPNVEDTSGDVLFFFGEFGEAAGHYEKANSLNPQWQGGFPLFKAAWARMCAADLTAADTLMDRYLALLRTSNKQIAELRAAQWQFLRGRRAEARSSLTAILGQGSLARPYRGLVASQLYVWDMAEGQLARLEAEFRARTPRYGLEVTPALAGLLQAGTAGLTPAERAAAISRAMGGNAPGALVAAATFLEARLHPPLSAEGLQALVMADNATPEASAMFTHALAAWGFLERGEAGEAAQIFARRVPPVAADDGMLWPLVFPVSLEWELEAWKQAGQNPPVPHMRKLVETLMPHASNGATP
ncbi:MAG: tetratricopeptide repeat protein [Bryobacterales bacterium]|nr:tetratricopeptide repeat protein [Bryobacterales bacterium]